MDIKEIKQIIDIVKRAELTEFEYEGKDLKLRISREGTKPVVTTSAPSPVYQALPEVVSPPAQQAPQAAAPVQEDDKSITFIKSPMVGTFYRASSPESPAFIETGASVSNDTIVCIIEAMKVMNEIQAELSGKIVEILVENGQSVEYGQPLFKVKQ